MSDHESPVAKSLPTPVSKLVRQDSPLPPLDGRLEAARIEIGGARLEGVVVEFEDDAPATGAPTP